MDPSFVAYRVAAAFLKKKLERTGHPLPSIGIVCGSGLAGLSKALEGKITTVQYSEIPGFPEDCSVAGHKGEVVFGELGGVPTMCFRGRFHSYEGHSMSTIVLPVRVMRCVGVKFVLLTNAAGGLNPDYKVGDVVPLSDHIAIPMMAGNNPLVGPNDDELGPRFPATSNAYPVDIRSVAVEAAMELGFDFVRHEGACYCFVSGPQFESKQECKLLRTLGGDAVGMSTVPEIVAAHHSGMKVLCLSLITNKVIFEGGEGPDANHEEVLEAVGKRGIKMQSLVKRIVSKLDKNILPALPDLRPIDLKVRKVKGKGTRYAFWIPFHCLVGSAIILSAPVVVGIGAKMLKKYGTNK